MISLYMDRLVSLETGRTGLDVYKHGAAPSPPIKGKAHAYAWVFPFIEWKLRESNGPLRKTSGGRFLGPGVIASEPRQKAATVRSDSPYVCDGVLCGRSDWRRTDWHVCA